LPVVLYELENWSLALREPRMGVAEDGVLSKILELKGMK
jgi:hypothetical protein